MTHQAATAASARRSTSPVDPDPSPAPEASPAPAASPGTGPDGASCAQGDRGKAGAGADRTRTWQVWFAAARNGDRAAYERFLRDVIPVIRGIVRTRAGGLGGSVEEDIVQEVLIAIHDKRHTWREGEPVQPWLYAITRYKIVDAFRRRGSRTSVPIEDMADALPAPEAADPTDGSDAMRVIGRLEPASADLVLAIMRQGATIRDLAAQFGITEGAARVRLHRATKRLGQLRRTMIE